MLSRTPFVCVLAVLVALPLAASAGPEQKARAAIQTAYANMDKAFTHHNIPAFLAYVDADTTVTGADGTVMHGREGVAAALQKASSLTKTQAMSTQIVSFALQDGGVVVATRVKTTLSVVREDKPAVIGSVDAVRDFWVQTGGRWLIKRERVLSDTLTMNGHPVITGDGPSAGAGGATAVSPTGTDPTRLMEPSGGFSYAPPDGWQIRTFPGLKYKICLAAPTQGFAPNISVVDEANSSTLDEYVQLNLDQLKQHFSEFRLLSQSEFVTMSGLHGARLTTTAVQTGKSLRQTYYLFPAAADRKIIVTATWLASDGDKYADIVNASMKTFALEPTATP